MQRSEKIGEIVAALAKARARFEPIGRSRSAKIKTRDGGEFTYDYADLASVINATAKGLAENGLVVIQPTHMEGGAVIVTTVLAHSSGEWFAEEMPWPVAGSDPRSIGSGITYARRNAYCAMLGVAAQEEDDDAEEARGGNHDVQRAQQQDQKHPARPPVEESDISRKLRAGIEDLIAQLPDALDKAKAKKSLGSVGHEIPLLGELEQWVRKRLPAQKAGGAA